MAIIPGAAIVILGLILAPAQECLLTFSIPFSSFLGDPLVCLVSTITERE